MSDDVQTGVNAQPVLSIEELETELKRVRAALQILKSWAVKTVSDGIARSDQSQVQALQKKLQEFS